MRGDVADDLLAEAALGGRAGHVGVGPAEVVASDALELGIALVDGGHQLTRSFVLVGVLVGVLGNAGGADPVAVGDRGQPLDVAAEDQADRLGLGLAQLRELVGHVGDRAVLLAQLLPDRAVAHRRGVPLVGEHLSQDLRGAQLGVLRSDPLEPLPDERHPAGREFPDGVVAPGLGQEPERLDGEVVVLLVEAVATRLGQREDLGRPAAAAGGLAARLARLDGALLEQLVEVAAYGGRGEVEPLGEGRGGRGSVDEDRPGDALTRRLVVPAQRASSSNSTTPVCLYCFDRFK